MAKIKLINKRAPIHVPRAEAAPVAHAPAKELADFNVIEVRTKSAGAITDLKPLTKYYVMEAAEGAEFQAINAAEIGDKIRKGIIVTKLFDKE